MAQKAYSESFGQHFIASKDLIPGELLITENPLAKVLDEKNYNSHCGNCSKELTKKILKCSACSSIVYCCISCQRSDWKIHKLECQGFRKAKPNRPNTMLRLLSRFLYAINLNPQMADGLGSNDPKERFKRNGDLGSLVSHKEKFSSSKLESYAEMIMGLPLIVEEHHLLSASDMITLMCIFSSNSMAICSEEGTNIGVGLYPLMAIANHSCNPNACVQFKDGIAHMRVIRPIKQGEQIFISYIESLDFKENRLKALHDQYFFHCKCTWCTEQDPFDFEMDHQTQNTMDSFKTQYINGDIHSYTLETLAIDYQKSMKIFPKNHIIPFHIRKQYFDKCLQNGNWRECIQLSLDNAKCLSMTYGDYFPLISISYYYIFKCAQHFSDSKSIELAREYGLAVCRNMKITHPNSDMYEQLCNEYRMWLTDLEYAGLEQ